MPSFMVSVRSWFLQVHQAKVEKGLEQRQGLTHTFIYISIINVAQCHNVAQFNRALEYKHEGKTHVLVM